MFVRYMSDLHLEFDPRDRQGVPHGLFVTPMVGDDDTVLVLAGDVGVVDSPNTIVPFIEEMTDRFKAVVYILGNHEYYSGSLVRTPVKLAEALAHTSVCLLNNSTVVIDEVKFIGTTMWTNYDNGDPLTIMECEASLNDFQRIRTGFTDSPYKRKVRAPDFHSRFLNAEAFLKSELFNTVTRDDQKCVVVTHHAPSYMSSPQQYIGNKINGAYAVELGNLIAFDGPDLWIHGHMHESADYEIASTNIVCNPRGYAPNDLNKGFNVCARVTL